MTVFSNNPYDRRMERLMMTVPNFAPKGVGFRFTEAQIFITATAATPTEILAETMRQIYRSRRQICCFGKLPSVKCLQRSCLLKLSKNI